MAYHLYIVDKDNNKLDLLGSVSQAKLDAFTTNFISPSDLLNTFELDSKKFKVLIENHNNNTIIEIPFCGSVYRFAVGLDSLTGLIDIINIASKANRKVIKDFSLNELLGYEKVLSSYENQRYKKLETIINMIDMDLEKNDNDEEFSIKYKTDEEYKNALKDYLKDSNGNILYSSAKNLASFLYSFNELNLVEKKKDEKLINEKKTYVRSCLSLDLETFSSGNLSKRTTKEYINKEDILNEVLLFHDDEEEIMNELDIRFDQRKMDLEEKNSFINKNKEKIFK